MGTRDWSVAVAERTMSDPAKIYRDATFSKETRDTLADDWETLPLSERAKLALREVVRCWDANGATEIVRQEDGTWTQA